MSDFIFKTLNDEGHKNWIKGGLGLLIVQTFLRDMLDYLLKRQYENILKGTSVTTDMYRHISGKVKGYHLFGMDKWSNSKLQNNKISDTERFNHVEFSKCFIRPTGYLEKRSISDIDCTGLIHILINNIGLHGRLRHPPVRDGQKVKEPNVLSQALDVRNDIIHSSKECLSTENLLLYLSQLIDFLDNIKPDESSGTEEEIQQANIRIKELQEIDFHVSSVNVRQAKAFVYQEQRREFQCKLIEFYEKFYVKTSICPFMQENNDVGIEEIYAKPNIEEFQNGVTRKIQPSHLLRQNRKDNKRVFVIGHVGTGKTSLCHFILQSWCHAVMDSRPNKSSTQSSDEFENIIAELKKFDFVFFLPLCASVLEGIDNFEKMIKVYYKELKNDEIIDYIFESERDSHRCLILADGLDEWKIPQKMNIPVHNMHGIPVLSESTKSTVIVTSRPTAIGILHMRKSDRDLEVNLLGVISIDSMVEKYYPKQDDTSVSKDDILKNIKKWTEDHKLDNPMLLSCFVWMLTKGHDIEQSCISGTYSSVINIMLEWLGNKPDITSSSSCDVQLPEMLEKNYIISPERRHVIMILGRIAFEMHNNSYAPICELDVKKYCTGDQLKCVLHSGILLKEMCSFPNKVTQFKFIHTLFLEYFVALHLVINNQHQTTNILKPLFENYIKATDIIGLSNVIVFVCGLSSQHIKSIFKHIYQSLSDQSTMVLKHKDIFQIQDLVTRCLLEHRSSSITEPPIILHYALLVSGEPNKFADAKLLLQNIDVGKIMILTIATCRVSNIVNDKCFFLKVGLVQKSEITSSSCLEIKGIRADNMKSLSISKCTMTHSEYLNLLSIISQASALELLLLEDIKCETNHNESHERHTVDLSNNSKIKSLSLIDKKNALLCKIDKQNLENCMLLQRNLSDIDFLTKAQNLQHLHIGCGDVCFGSFTSQMNRVLQALAKLQTLHVRNMVCSDVCPIGSDSMKDLHNIKLSNVKVTPESFRKFLDDIVDLQQYVKVEAHCLFETKEELNNSVEMITKIKAFDKQASKLKIIENSVILMLELGTSP